LTEACEEVTGNCDWRKYCAGGRRAGAKRKILMPSLVFLLPDEK
jgi:hypothetical protein